LLLVDQKFQDSKARSKEALSVSREAMGQYHEEHPIVKDYRQIEEARLKWEADLKEANANGEPEPSREGVDLRSMDELENELETKKAQLEITLATNAGVVEQYEKRQRDVRFFSCSIVSSNVPDAELTFLMYVRLNLWRRLSKRDRRGRTVLSGISRMPESIGSPLWRSSCAALTTTSLLRWTVCRFRFLTWTLTDA
jgi:hypothetical protein